MQTIRVNKQQLIDKIKANRDEHRDQFLAAQEKFREKAIELLDQHLADARAGKKIHLMVQLPEPVDYTYSYETALSMLEWEQAEEVELEREDFERYVENNWEWQRHWASNTGSYLAS